MKSFALTLGALAVMVVAQDTSGVPECGQICATNMLSSSKADELDCDANDIACLCQNQDFIYGIRDCSTATCGSDEARQVIEFGISLCRDAGVQITTNSGGEPTITGTNTGGSGIVTTISSDGEAITTVTGTPSSGSADTTVTETATETGTPSASESNTSGGLIGSLSSEAADLSSSAGEIISSLTSAAGGLVSTITSDGSTFLETLSTAVNPSETGDSTETDAGATSTESDGAAVPQRTMAPVGIIAAGLAAFLI